MKEGRANAKILIVDDEPSHLDLLLALLSRYGYAFETASNGKDAVEKARAFTPSLILMDIFMPEMNGIEVTQKIRTDPALQHIPIIMLTGLGDTRVKIRCLEAGASDFLEKPVNPMELAIKVNNFLKLQEYEEVKLRNEILTDSKKILEEKNRELERAYCDLKSAQSQILQQEKMASIGQLAAGIAHEINNPVGFIMSNLNTLQKFATRLKDFIKSQTDSLEKMAERKEESGLLLERVREQRKSLKIDYIMGDMENLIRESFDGAARMKQIVQDLKSFSRVGEERHVPSDINAGIESTVNIVWNELKYKAVLKKEYGEIPLVRCNIGQLNQVFMNILVNAAHAIEKQGEITVRTWQEGDSVYVSFSDTGCGIPPEHLNRIFEPFFTTKEVGRGTGLGLSIAYDIVKKNNGEIRVESRVGEGSTFTIRIPGAEDE